MAQNVAGTPVEAASAPTVASPGDVVCLRVRSPRPAPVEGELLGRSVLFSPSEGESWTGLAAVPLDTPAGTYVISTRVRTGDGPVTVRETPLRVQKKSFETRRIRVADSFVNPPAGERERIVAEAELLARIMSHSSGERLWDGPFVVPVPGAATSSFGRLTILNGRAQGRHQGADFRAATGTPVRAPNAGKVVLSAPLYFSGNTVVIDHGAGLLSLLGHLSRLAVGEGAVVSKGDLLGDSGATGRVTGPHLHWAVRLQNVSVDPQALMQAVADPATCSETP